MNEAVLYLIFSIGLIMGLWAGYLWGSSEGRASERWKQERAAFDRMHNAKTQHYQEVATKTERIEKLETAIDAILRDIRAYCPEMMDDQ